MQQFMHSTVFGKEKAHWESQMQPYQKWAIQLWQPVWMCAICHMASDRRRGGGGGGRRYCRNNLYTLTMTLHFYNTIMFPQRQTNKSQLLNMITLELLSPTYTQHCPHPLHMHEKITTHTLHNTLQKELTFSCSKSASFCQGHFVMMK